MSGNKIIHAILDGGASWYHFDDNDYLYVNTSEIPGDGIDNDGNGLVDDYVGLDILNGSSSLSGPASNNYLPIIENSHGNAMMHKSIGRYNAAQNHLNMDLDIGVTPVKILGASGSSLWGDIISGTQAAFAHGAKVISLSLSLSDTFYLNQLNSIAEDAGGIVVTYPGNQSQDIGEGGEYDSLIQVTNTVDPLRGPAVDFVDEVGAKSDAIAKVAAELTSIWAVNPGFSAKDVLDIAYQASDSVSGTNHGELDFYEALDIATTYEPSAPEPEVILPTLEGDFDADGDVDDHDLGIAISNFTGPTSAGGEKTFFEGDVNGDGDVDDHDLGIAISNFTGPGSGEVFDPYSVSGEVVNGGVGDDDLDGASGHDYLHGFLGNDHLYGGGGDDILFGFSGNDILIGGEGQDIMTGGSGADTFVFGGEALFDEAVDVINDFNHQLGDVLDISNLLSDFYDPLTDLIFDFIEITDNGEDTFIAVSAEGEINTFVQLVDVTGVSEENIIEAVVVV